MLTFFERAVEIVFTSYLLPALMLPLLWLARAARPRRSPPAVSESVRHLSRLVHGYLVVSALLLLAWMLARYGVPIEAGGRISLLFVGAAFSALNLLFADLTTGMVSRYAALPDETTKNSLYLRYIAVVLMQPLGTAAGMSLLYGALRIVHPQAVPGIEAAPGPGI